MVIGPSASAGIPVDTGRRASLMKFNLKRALS